MLDKKSLLGSRKTSTLELEKLGQVRVQELSAMQQTRIGLLIAERGGDAESMSMEDIADIMPEVIAWGLVDEHYTPAEVESIPGEYVEELIAIAVEVLKLSGLWVDAESGDPKVSD